MQQTLKLYSNFDKSLRAKLYIAYKIPKLMSLQKIKINTEFNVL